MSEQNQSFDEEELRNAIRSEIEQRDLERKKAQQRKEARQNASEQAELKRRIYREELQRYYQNRPGYEEIVGEDGEPEYVLIEEKKEAEGLFDQVVEDPIQARKSQRMILFAIGAFVIISAVFLWYMMYEGVGTITVTCNVPGAKIIMDAIPTNEVTDATVVEVPAGEHFVTVKKEGYRIVGQPVIVVDVKKDEDISLGFILEPDPFGLSSDSNQSDTTQ